MDILSSVGASVFAWGVFAWVFLRIDRVFLRVSCRSRYCEKMLTSVHENRNRNRKLNSPGGTQHNCIHLSPTDNR